MQVLSKREREMNLEEKTKLDFIRTWIIAEHGFNFRTSTDNIDLTDRCNKALLLDIILRKFNISYRNNNDVKNCFPENLTIYPGHKDYNECMAQIEQKRDSNKNVLMDFKNGRLKLLNSMEELMRKKEVNESKSIEKEIENEDEKIEKEDKKIKDDRPKTQTKKEK